MRSPAPLFTAGYKKIRRPRTSPHGGAGARKPAWFSLCLLHRRLSRQASRSVAVGSGSDAPGCPKEIQVNDVIHDPARASLAGRIARGPGAARAGRPPGATGLPRVVVSNQPGIAPGRCIENKLGAVRQRFAELFEANGAALADFFCCPHHPRGSVPACPIDRVCRKPRPRRLRRALASLGGGSEWSRLIGNIPDDVEAGRAARYGKILVDCGRETESRIDAARTSQHGGERDELKADIVMREAVRRRGTRRAPPHVAERIAAPIAIEPVSPYWRLRGALHFRVPFV
ncbi:HAD hydrolase-like protein [Burkholderia metallica]